MSKRTVFHTPKPGGVEGFCICGKRISHHEVEHKFSGNGEICELCSLPTNQHRDRSARNRTRTAKRKARKKRPYKPRPLKEFAFFGIDGEGQNVQTKRGSRHFYNFIGVSDHSGKRIYQLDPRKGELRLRTEDCLNFLLSLPRTRAKFFSYSFNYDLTKILNDVDNGTLFLLFRPDRRRRAIDEMKGPHAIPWTAPSGKKFLLNLQGTKFTLHHGKQKIVIWDIFKFYGCKFTEALKNWGVGDPTAVAEMTVMKDLRSKFDELTPERIKAYCLEECKCIAELARRLTVAHQEAGLPLHKYYGAGSSGEAMLTKLEIEDKIRPPPADMIPAIACAFSGGRFENIELGPSKPFPGEVLESWDISSAYPYHTTFLPCLEHGEWSLISDEREALQARAACVHYGFDAREHEAYSAEFHRNFSRMPWGPFPFRERDGTITYPSISGGGWVWSDEYKAGAAIFPHVRFREAWIYKSECDCQPFKEIPQYYLVRIKLGKEGAGLTIKLGVNSVYGKLAQSVGTARFNCWIWAGIITSGCRAQILGMLGMHKDPRNMIMVATDSVLTRERLTPPSPKDTGTDVLLTGGPNPKPLGGWEKKVYSKGVFLARPGVYFPLDPTEEEVKDVRARGVGKSVLIKHWQAILSAYNMGESSVVIWCDYCARSACTIHKTSINLSRFCGAKTSISWSPKKKRFTRASARDGIKPAFGEWIGRKIEMTFDPMPKRQCVERDGVTLRIRRFPLTLESEPYAPAMGTGRNAPLSEEALELIAYAEEMAEQPDYDLTEFVN